MRSFPPSSDFRLLEDGTLHVARYVPGGWRGPTGMKIESAQVKNILTRTSGYLKDVCSHSLQPYRGCSFGRALCGVGCYVRHNPWVTRGRPWGGFLEVRENAAQSYLSRYEAERRWARKARGAMSVFLSSASEPFLPQERRYRVTRDVLEAMRGCPPDRLILQTHSHEVASHQGLLRQLADVLSLRVHISIETDRAHLAGLPPHASTVEERLRAVDCLSQAGLFTVITVSPLLPIADPEAFFARIAQSASAVVIDHFIEGDGTPDGRRTRATPLPEVMESLHPGSSGLSYRDEVVSIARRHLPGRVGVSAAGFAGRYR